MFIVSGLYCSQRFQNIIPYHTHVYRKLTAVYKTGTGVKGTHVWGLWDLGTSSIVHVGQGCGASNTGTQGTQGYEWFLQKSEVNARFTVAHRDKHFPESKTLPTNENTPQSPKYIPESKTCSRIQNTSQNVKTLPRTYLRWLLGTKHVPESKIVLDSGMCFGFWEVFLNSRKCHFGFWEVVWILGCVLDFGKCFWILGSVLSLRATVDISHFPHEYVLVKQPTLPSLWFQRFHCLQCRQSSPG